MFASSETKIQTLQKARSDVKSQNWAGFCSNRIDERELVENNNIVDYDVTFLYFSERDDLAFSGSSMWRCKEFWKFGTTLVRDLFGC